MAANEIETADNRLLHALACGDVTTSEEVGLALIATLNAGAADTTDELSDQRIFQEGFHALLRGIRALRSGDLDSGIAIFDETLGSHYLPDLLRWASALWLTRSASRRGSPKLETQSSESLVALSDGLGDEALILSLIAKGRRHLYSGDFICAELDLTKALHLSDEHIRASLRGSAWLAVAEVRSTSGDSSGAAQAARCALREDPTHDAAVLFLAEEALTSGALAEAQDIVRDYCAAAEANNFLIEVLEALEIVDSTRLSAEQVAEFLKSLRTPLNADTQAITETVTLRQPHLIRWLRHQSWLLYYGDVKIDLEPEECVTRKKQDVAAESPFGGTAGFGAKNVFAGDLELLSVPDLLEFLRTSRRTGTVYITTYSATGDEKCGTIRLVSGAIAGAYGPECESLTAAVIRLGWTDEHSLDEALPLHMLSPDDPIDPGLLFHTINTTNASVAIERSEFEAIYLKQIGDVLFELVRWPSGRFSFTPAGSSDQEELIETSVPQIVADTHATLLDVLCRLDEEAR